MKKVLLSGIILILVASIFFVPSSRGASGGDIEIFSDLQILDVGDVFGGHITWVIHGEYAKELRTAIGEKYGVSRIDLGTASKYFKQELERVVENNRFGCGYLAFVRITRADPLHDDTQGILNNPDDVAGLIGPVNSTSDITLRMLIRGEPMDGRHFAVTDNLTFAPFYALVNNQSEISKFDLNSASVEKHHSEILAGLGSLNYPSGFFTLRLILGQYVSMGGEWIEYSPFDPLNSPLILFVIFAASAYLIKKFSEVMGKEKRGTLRERKAKNFGNVMKIILFAIYLLLPLYGIWYMVIVGISLAGSYFGMKKIYGS